MRFIVRSNFVLLDEDIECLVSSCLDNSLSMKTEKKSFASILHHMELRSSSDEKMTSTRSVPLSLPFS
jgi:hypothetical protein